MQNETFVESVRSFQPMDSIQYLYVDTRFTQEQNEAILESYIAEATENELANGYYYRTRANDTRPDGTEVVHGTNQTVTTIASAGYIGSFRYYNTNTLRLEVPDTISLLMQTYNSYADEEPLSEFTEVMAQFEAGLALEDDSLSFSVAVFNYPDEDGFLVRESFSFYINDYEINSENNYDQLQLEYCKKFADILARASLTDDPDCMFIRMYWYYYDSSVDEDYDDRKRPTIYLRFDDEEDEQEFLDLIEAWETDQLTVMYY